MLTNNKKNFVRSIAMLLAMLMVMAVCLTGCGNKTADEALTKAEEAKTVADEVKAALADYLKNADAEAKVSALVDAALADGYASAEELDALAKKLEQYVTTDKVAELIKNEVAAAAIEGAMTKDEIMKILENYYTKDEVDAKLKNYFGEFSAEAVQKMLKDVDKAMNEEEWDKASDIVIATIEDMQDLIKALQNGTYTQANMAAVNKALEPLNIVAFEKDDDGKTLVTREDEYGDEFAKLLEYTILRVASVDAMNDLKDAVSDALAVPTFESEVVALANSLYALGELVPFGSYDSDNKFVADKWTTAGSYHGVKYAKGAQKLTQVVTLNDKEAFHAWIKAYDALMVTYAKENLADLDYFAVSNVFSQTTTTNGTTMVSIAASTNATMDGWTKVGETVFGDYSDYLHQVYGNSLKDNEIMKLPGVDGWISNRVMTDYKTTGKYADSGAGGEGDYKIYSDASNNSAIDTEVVNMFGYAYAAATVQLEDAYFSVLQQLDACQDAVNKVNGIFGTDAIATNFLYGTIYKNALATKQWANVTDADLLNALTADMCEDGGVKEYPKYLLTDVVSAMDRSLMINGKSSVGIKKYDLYLQMIAKSYDLLWSKYQNLAYEWLDQILADYMSVVDYAKEKGSTDAAQWPSQKNVTSESEFINAFATGTAFTTSEIYKSLKVDFSNNNLWMYYKNNGAAYTFGGVGGTSVTFSAFLADPVKTIKSNAEDVKLRLTGSVLDFNIRIANADKAALKESGVSVDRAFYSILKEAIANLDEVYDRFLLDDYKMMVYNDTKVLADKVVDFYYLEDSGVKNGTSAEYENVTKEQVKAAVQQYLFAVDMTDTAKLAFSNTPTTKDGKITQLNPGENKLGEKLGVKLNNNQLVANVSTISVNKYSTDATKKDAAEAMAKIDTYAAQAIAKVENLIIKANFEDYLNLARANSLTVKKAYFDATKLANQGDDTYGMFGDVLVSISLTAADTDDSISIVSYQAKRGESGLALDDFKATYIEVLKLIADKNNPHIALLKGESISKVVANYSTYMKDVFDSKIKEVKTSAVPVVDNIDAKWGEKTKAPIQIGTYDYIGSAVVELDKVANAHTYYTVTKDNKSTEYKLY